MGHLRNSRGFDGLGCEASDEHSAAFLDTQWLGREIRSYLAANGSIRGPFCLLGIRALIDFGSVISIQPRYDLADWEPRPQLIPIPDGRALAAAVSALEQRRKRLRTSKTTELLLFIQDDRSDYHVHSAKLWRDETRHLLARSRLVQHKGDAPLPFLVRHRELYIERDGLEDEVTIQLFLILYQWGLATVTKADNDAVIQCICRIWNVREGNDDESFRSAAEQTASYLFTNWVMPQSARDFRAYVRKVAFGQYLSERGHGPATEKAESEMVRASFGYARKKGARKFLSVAQLAAQSGMYRQRINEAIRSGKLPHSKWRGKYWIEESDAEKFLRSVGPVLAARELRKQLRKAGKDKAAEALRKWINRRRKAGASNEQILERLREIRSNVYRENQ